MKEVVKKEIIKLFDAGVIYAIEDSPWLNEATRKEHFPLPLMDQMLERLAGNKFFCFLDGFPGYFQIPIEPVNQEKTTFTCPYGTYAYKRMPFGLCNAPTTLQSPLGFGENIRGTYALIQGISESLDDVARLFVNVKVTAFSYSKGFGLAWFNTHAYSQEALVSSLAWLLEVILNNDFQQKGDDDLTNDEYDQYDEYDKYDE
ncbi:hypothetical protein Tco_0242777 [Tanacetum coccineum]